MNGRISGAVAVAAVLTTAYVTWAGAGRLAARPTTTGPIAIASSGRTSRSGNLLGVQVFVAPADFASESTFEAKLDAYLIAARRHGLLDERTVVVLPEYIGTWLVALDEKAAVHDAASLDEAMGLLISSNLPSFAEALLASTGEDPIVEAIFRMKAKRMAAVYASVLGRLASRYEVTIVGGSIVLPDPAVVDGQLRVGDGALYNVSVLFDPDGRPRAPPVRKAFPITDEQPFTAAGDADDLPVFDTPAGRLGVLICADSWFPTTYRRMRERGAELIAVPSYLAHAGGWRRPWLGYAGFDAPADVDLADVHAITEGRAWSKYALAGRFASADAKAAINVFLRGEVWGVGSDGRSIGVTDRVQEAPTGPALLNVWIPERVTEGRTPR